MKFAFLIMGHFSCEKDRAVIGDGNAQIIGVANMEEACMVAKTLYEEGIDCIELCGAFKEEGAKAVIAATQNKIPVGYITHLPEQEALFKAAFSKS